MLTQILRWCTVGGVFAVPIIVPFIVSASMFFPYITGKNFTFRIIVGLTAIAWVLLATLDARYRPRFSWILGAVALFVAIIGIADLQGVNVFKSIWSNFERMEGFVALAHLLLYFVIAGTVLNTERLWQAFWYSTLGISVIIAIIGLQPVFKVFPSLQIPRIDATFGNPIYFAVYCLFHIFIALVLIMRWRGAHAHQVILGFVALLHLVAMVLTSTRGTVIGFIAGALVTTVLVALLERERPLLRKTALGALLCVVVVVGAAYAVRDTEWAKTTPIVSRFTQISLTEGTVKARFMNWGVAWEGVKERPVLGWGQDNYEYVFAKYFDPNMYNEEPWFDRTHNVLFDWLIAGGFLGLIAYLLIPLAALSHLWVLDPAERRFRWGNLLRLSAIHTFLAKRDAHFSVTERALWTGLIVAYLSHNLFVFDNIISYILFMAVLAYLHARVTEGHDPLFANYEVRRETGVAVVLPVVLVVGGILMWYVNMPGIQTSQLLITALMPQRTLADGTQVPVTPEQSLEAYKSAIAIDQMGRQEVREQLVQRAVQMLRAEGVSDATKIAFRDLALTEMEREVARNEKSPRLQLFYGSLLGSVGRLEDAEKTLEHAVTLAPTKQTALFQLGEVKALLGKQDEALEIFKRAYEFVPRFEEARKSYAIQLVRTGQDKEAVDLLTEHYGSAIVDDERLFRAWVEAKRYDIVVGILEARVEKNPGNVQQVVSLAAAYKETGRIDEAIALLRRTGETSPEYKDQMDNFINELRAVGTQP